MAYVRSTFLYSWHIFSTTVSSSVRLPFTILMWWVLLLPIHISRCHSRFNYTIRLISKDRSGNNSIKATTMLFNSNEAIRAWLENMDQQPWFRETPSCIHFNQSYYTTVSLHQVVWLDKRHGVLVHSITALRLITTLYYPAVQVSVN